MKAVVGTFTKGKPLGAFFGSSGTVKTSRRSVDSSTEAPFSSYALGAHSWQIEGDHPTCSPKGRPHSRLLKLTGCREGDFTCSDGQCIR